MNIFKNEQYWFWEHKIETQFKDQLVPQGETVYNYML